MKIEIWYSIQNGGDGSVYVKFMESEELCEIDQQFLYETWGEPCLGCISLESNSPITITFDGFEEKIMTVDMEIAEVEDELSESWKSDDERRRLGEKLVRLKALKMLRSKNKEVIS